MTRTRIAPPAMRPVLLDEVKAHLRLESEDEDGYVSDLLDAAISQIETETGHCLIRQTWRLFLDGPPATGCLVLPVKPVLEVLAVTGYDGTGSPIPLPTSAWSLLAFAEPPQLALEAEPAAMVNGLEIDVACGFGETAADVPDALRRAILMLVSHWHTFRGAASEAAAGGLVPPAGQSPYPSSRNRLAGFDRRVAGALSEAGNGGAGGVLVRR